MSSISRRRLLAGSAAVVAAGAALPTALGSASARPPRAPARPQRLTLVLIHGAWHDGSAWSQVAQILRDAGHTVHTPTLPGHGPGADRDVTHEDCVQAVTDLIVGQDLADVVLVGHSSGGTVISRVAEEIPDRVARLVFQNGFVLQPGHSLLDEVPPHYRQLFAQLAAASADNTVALPWPIWREAFIGDADADAARAAYQRLSPEPYAMFAAALDLTKFYDLLQRGAVGASYIHAVSDTALPPGETWGWHPRMSSRLGLYRLVQLAGSHEVVYTAPDRLARAILDAARD